MRRAPLLLLAGLLVPAPGHAALAPPEIVSFHAEPHLEGNQDATEVFAIGEAIFSGEDPVTVGMDPQFDPQRRELGLFGMDARNIAIWQPSIADNTLWFAMSFWDLQVVAPELATWRWTFKLNGVTYQLEAMRGGATAASTLEAGPEMIIASASMTDQFRLLGPCNTADNQLRCPLNRSVSGQIDMNADRLVWKVPIELPFEIGAVISPHPAGAVAAFGSTFTDTVTQTESYTALDRRVLLSVQLPDGTTVIPPGLAVLAAFEDAGKTPFFSNLLVGSLDRGIAGPTNPYDVVAVACAGTNCGEPAVSQIKL